jgi:hypothetical protein
MPLSLRSTLLLSAALLGAAGTAVGAPQHRREPPQQRAEAREPPRQSAPRPEPRFDRSEPRRLDQPRRAEFRRPNTRGEDALSDSIRRVEQRTRGQVLSAERVPYDGRNVNRIKVVDDRGRVRVYMDDPQAPAGDGAPTRDNDD